MTQKCVHIKIVSSCAGSDHFSCLVSPVTIKIHCHNLQLNASSHILETYLARLVEVIPILEIVAQDIQDREEEEETHLSHDLAISAHL